MYFLSPLNGWRCAETMCVHLLINPPNNSIRCFHCLTSQGLTFYNFTLLQRRGALSAGQGFEISASCPQATVLFIAAHALYVHRHVS